MVSLGRRLHVGIRLERVLDWCHTMNLMRDMNEVGEGRQVTFATLVNDHAQFDRCRQSVSASGQSIVPWIVVEPNARGWNAARGLNHALDKARTPWVVCAHQDVLLPRGWVDRVERLLGSVSSNVALVGIVGTQQDGSYRGHIVDPNGHCYWGPLPDEVLTLDEAVLVVRREAGLRFNEEIPGFHCYGADICLQARSKGLKALVVDAPVQHLSTGRLDRSYDEAKRWLLSKWGPEYGYILPTPASVIKDNRRASILRRIAYRWRLRRDCRARKRHGQKFDLANMDW